MGGRVKRRARRPELFKSTIGRSGEGYGSDPDVVLNQCGTDRRPPLREGRGRLPGRGGGAAAGFFERGQRGAPGVQRGKFSLVAVKDQKAVRCHNDVAAAQSLIRRKMFDRRESDAFRRRQRSLTLGGGFLSACGLAMGVNCRVSHRVLAGMRGGRGRRDAWLPAPEKNLDRIASLRGGRKRQRRNCGAKDKARG